MGLKELILRKGWAGTTFSRQETVERINPIIRQHYVLNHYYDYAIRHLTDRSIAKELERLQKTARTDIGKLSETVLSAGGASYNGTDLEPDDFNLGTNNGEMLQRLVEVEQSFFDQVEAEQKENHQIRTRAILSVVHTNSQARLNYVRDVAKKHA